MVGSETQQRLIAWAGGCAAIVPHHHTNEGGVCHPDPGRPVRTVGVLASQHNFPPAAFLGAVRAACTDLGVELSLRVSPEGAAAATTAWPDGAASMAARRSAAQVAPRGCFAGSSHRSMADAQWLTPWPPAPWLAPATSASLTSHRRGAQPRERSAARGGRGDPNPSPQPPTPSPQPQPQPNSHPLQGLADQARHHEALRGVDVALVWPREEARLLA